ncbi:OPY2 [Fusarium acutatum]|uniref:OPY2 n=1 Tax=Fusarium acutatum TaxID=78861 RepID=A0A8H4J9X7_9HYPO|nr:OPY2 [Fusarium acutatum]
MLAKLRAPIFYQFLYCAQCTTSASKRDVEVESHKEGGGLTIGGIIGGVIGSIIITSIATYLVWRFYVKPKRLQTPTSIRIEAEDPIQSSENDPAMRGASLQSTHTIHSMAPTILTRASNIIQIAYIPDVINQATLTSPNP